MSLYKTRLLGIDFSKASPETILKYIEKWLNTGKSHKVYKNISENNSLIIVTPNPEQVVYAGKHKEFARLLNNADISIPDGIGIILANRILNGDAMLGKIAGIDLMKNLIQLVNKESIRIALIGGHPGVAVEALNCLRKTYPDLTGWAESGPKISIEYLVSTIERKEKKLNTEYKILNTPLDNENNYIGEVAERIKKTNTRLVFIGLGAPKQEYFMEILRKKLTEMNYGVILMAVGGSFDEIAGRIKSVPHWMDDAGLKWFWRLMQEPWRWRRQLALLTFIGLVTREKLRNTFRF